MLLHAHSGIRYLVVLAGVLVIAYGLFGWATKRPFDTRMRVLGGVFAGLFHLNILLGLGVLFTRRFYPQLAGHVLMVVFAAVVAQIVPSVMRRRAEEDRSYLPYVISSVAALGLLWAALLAIGRRSLI